MAMKHEEDPRQEILKKIGDISDIEIFNNQILVGIYFRPTKTAGGIHLPDQVRAEDRFQGKVGLVLKKGPAAFVDETGKWFQGMDVDIGDWIVLRPSDGWAINIYGVECRLVEDTSVRVRIPAPDAVW
jgi:co-chaperonin GroES (HSP10)